MMLISLHYKNSIKLFEKMDVKNILKYKEKDLKRMIDGAVEDNMRELYCMIMAYERGEGAANAMSSEEYALALGSLRDCGFDI